MRHLFSRVVRESGGVNATIVVIPTASSIPVEVSENYLHAFNKLDCNNVHIMDIRNREDAEKPEFLELMQKAMLFHYDVGYCHKQHPHKYQACLLPQVS